MNKDKILELLNSILEHELAGVIRYSHYALMVFGPNRIPICSWLRSQAQESLSHAEASGELITAFGGHPSLKIAKLLETHKHSVEDILKESLEHERDAVNQYKLLLREAEDHSILLEEYARKYIAKEEEHLSIVEKMLRKQERSIQ